MDFEIHHCLRGCGKYAYHQLDQEVHDETCPNRGIDPNDLENVLLDDGVTPMELAKLLRKCTMRDHRCVPNRERYFGLGDLNVLGAWQSFFKYQVPFGENANLRVSESVVAASLLKGNLKSDFERWIDEAPETFRVENNTYGLSAYIKSLRSKKSSNSLWQVPAIVAVKQSKAPDSHGLDTNVCFYCGTNQQLCKKFRKKLKACQGQCAKGSEGSAGAAKYCGRDCQRLDWKFHKNTCQPSTNYSFRIPRIRKDVDLPGWI